MMLWIARRVSLISRSAAVPRIGKKRIRCSGGGSTVMSLMRWSSVSLVLSAGCACQSSDCAAVLGGFIVGLLFSNRMGKKKPPGCRRFFECLVAFLERAQFSLPPGDGRCQKSPKKNARREVMSANVSQPQLLPPLHGALHLRLRQRAERGRVPLLGAHPLFVHIDHQHAFAERAPRDELEVLSR